MNTLLYYYEEGFYASVKGVDFVNSLVVIADIDNPDREVSINLADFDGEVAKINPLNVAMLGLTDDNQLELTGLLNYDVISNGENYFKVVLNQVSKVVSFIDLDGELCELGIHTTVDLDGLEKHIENNYSEYYIDGNYFDLVNTIENEEEFDLSFDVKIVKDVSKEGVVYYYACNDKKGEVIDLIEVIFVGATILNGTYNRLQYSYEEYEEFIVGGVLEEVSPFELQAYAMSSITKQSGITIGNALSSIADRLEGELPDEDEDEDEDSDVCDCIWCKSDQSLLN